MEASLNNTLEKDLFSVKQMRWLLVEIKDIDPEVGIKLRLKSHGWQSIFYKIIHISDTNVVVVDEKNNQLKFITLDDITQFSINKAFQKMRPNIHYAIRA
jgi:uncharacterized protein YjiK